MWCQNKTDWLIDMSTFHQHWKCQQTDCVITWTTYTSIQYVNKLITDWIWTGEQLSLTSKDPNLCTKLITIIYTQSIQNYNHRLSIRACDSQKHMTSVVTWIHKHIDTHSLTIVFLFLHQRHLIQSNYVHRTDESILTELNTADSF